MSNSRPSSMTGFGCNGAAPTRPFDSNQTRGFTGMNATVGLGQGAPPAMPRALGPVGQPGMPPQPPAITPHLQPHYDDARSREGERRKRGTDALWDHAKDGDRDGANALVHLATDPRATWNLDHGSRQQLRTDILQGFEKNAHLLDQGHIDPLVSSLDNESAPGRSAARVLGQMAASNDHRGAATAQALRDRIAQGDMPGVDERTGGPPARFRAAEALAKAQGTPHFQQDDWKLLAGNHSNTGDEGLAARDAVQNAVKAGNPDALAGARSVVRGEQGEGLDQRDRAASVFEAVPEAIGRQDVEDLTTLAARDGSTVAVGALHKGADRQPPAAGAAEALGTVIDAGGDARNAAERSLVDLYPRLSAGQKEAMARHVLAADTKDEGVLRQAVDATKGNGVETAAIGRLVERTDLSNVLRGHAAEKLRDAAAGGNENAVKALGKAAESKDPKASNFGHVALKDAATKGSEKAVDELARLSRIPEGSKALSALGDLAKDLPAGDPRTNMAMAALRGALGDPDERKAIQAAREMAKSVDKMSEADRRALLDQVEADRKDLAVESLSALSDAARKMPAGPEREALAREMRQKFDAIAPQLGPQAAGAMMATLAADPASAESRQMLQKALGEHPNDTARYMAARALADKGVFEGLPKAQQDKVVAEISANEDWTTAKSLLERHPEWARSPMNDQKLQGIAKEYTERVQKEIEHADPSSPLGKYARLMAARQMGYDINNPDAEKRRMAWKIDVGRVDEELTKLMKSPKFQRDMERIRQDVVKNHKGLADQQKAYLMGDDFRRAMDLTPPDQRRDLVQAELGKLGAIDKEAAKEVHGALMARQAQENVGQIAKEAHKKEGGLDLHAEAIREMAHAYDKDAKMGSKAAKNIAKSLGELEKGAAKEAQLAAKVASRLQQFDRELEEAHRAGQIAEGAYKAEKAALADSKNWLVKLENKGVLSTVATATSMYALGSDLYKNGMPKGLDDPRFWAMTKDITSAVGSADSMAKMSKFFMKDGISEASKLGKTLKALKWAGPVSDAGGAVLDGYSAYKSAKEGDAGRTMGYGMQAAGGVASAAAGVAILAGASGPAAPIVLIGGTLLIGGGMLVNYFFGDTDEEKFLKTMGRDFGYGNDHFYHDKYNRRSRTLVNGAPPPLRLD